MKRIKYPERLLKLADLLEADAKDRKGIKFDYQNWGSIEHDRKLKRAPVSCHTTACAMGLAAISGKFKRFGLDHTVELEKYAFDNTFWGDIQFLWNGRRIEGVTAARRLFGIDEPDALHLFVNGLGLDGVFVDRHGARGERAVAKLIRDFVKNFA